MKTKKKEQYMMAFEIPPKMHEALKASATKNFRSVSAEIRHILAIALGLIKE